MRDEKEEMIKTDWMTNRKREMERYSISLK